MNHLSGMDASFLHLETPETPMHVGGMHKLALPDGYTGDFYEDFKQHIVNRLHISEIFTRKLALMPFEMSDPVWVEDDEVDVDYHIRRVTLPKPGTHRQLEQYVARLHSSLLDRSRPLWEFFVIDGLEDAGDRKQVALYTKVHHAGIDGQAGVAFATAIMDATPEPRPVRPPRQQRRPHRYQLGMAELATAAIKNTLQQYVKLVTTLPDMARAFQSVVMPQPAAEPKGQGAPVAWNLKRDTKLLGPKTIFNVSITNQRAYAGRSIPLAETKQIGKRLGFSLNDVVLATCGGALRRYLSEYNALPKRPLTAAVPVSLREAGNTDANNQVSMTVMSLATDVDDPIERLKAINTSSVAAKSLMGKVKAAIPTDFPAFAAPWLMSGLASMYGRSGLANALPPMANVAVSNVPGAQVPLYVCGARMLSYFPVSIATHGVALNITVQSYNGSLDYGLIACRRAVPDVEDLADFVVDEHRRLMTASLQLEAERAPDAAARTPAGAAPAVVPEAAAPRPDAATRASGPAGTGVRHATPEAASSPPEPAPADGRRATATRTSLESPRAGGRVGPAKRPARRAAASTAGSAGDGSTRRAVDDAAEPAAKLATGLATRSATKSAPRSASRAAAVKRAVKPAAKPAANAAPKRAAAGGAKGAAKGASKRAAQGAAERAAANAVKQVAKAAANPVAKAAGTRAREAAKARNTNGARTRAAEPAAPTKKIAKAAQTDADAGRGAAGAGDAGPVAAGTKAARKTPPRGRALH